MKVKVLIIFCLLIASATYAQTNNKINHIRLFLENKKLDNLDLILTLEGKNKKLFTGKTLDGKNWDFLYPDSLYDFVRYFDFNDKRKEDTVSHSIVFGIKIDKDTLKAAGVYFDRRNVNIEAKFSKTSRYPNTQFLAKDDSVKTRTDIEYEYFVAQPIDTQFIASIEGFGNLYSFFYKTLHGKSITYEQALQNYIALTQKYPQSHALLSGLANKMSYYRSTNDIKSVYNVFSERIKGTYYGRIIKKKLEMEYFENMSLENWKTKKPEPIVRDTNHFSLIIFSASWCQPCHEQLPLVRALHEKLGENLDIVFISIDDKSTIGNWIQMMQKGEIPVRSLLASKEIMAVKNKYFVQSIPYSLAISPKGKIDIIDLRNESERIKLEKAVSEYERINNKKK